MHGCIVESATLEFAIREKRSRKSAILEAASLEQRTSDEGVLKVAFRKIYILGENVMQDRLDEIGHVKIRKIGYGSGDAGPYNIIFEEFLDGSPREVHLLLAFIDPRKCLQLLAFRY